MKKIISLILFTFVSLSAINANATTYYIKSTGGTCGGASPRCNGTSTADDPGSGTNQNCACKYGLQAIGHWADGSSGGQAGIISGGDTLIFLDESPMGYDAALTGCSTSFPYGCVARPIPSGTAGNTTKIYGVNHASCNNDYSNLTKVWGKERASHIFDLGGNDYIDFKCLDITDKSSCVTNVITQASDGTSTYVCNRSGSYPLGDHADSGIKSLTGTTSNITLDHVKITGLVNGVYAQKKQNWTGNYLYIGFNSSVNWDNDIDGSGATSPNHDEGNITLTNYTNVYAGCGEVWNSRGTPYYCTSQDQSGYGDAHSTGGGNNANYTFEDVVFAHNVSDDIDNLYDDGTTTTMKVIRGNFQGSSGQAIKSAAATTYVENTVAVGNCGYFKDKSFTTFANEQSGRSGTSCNNNAICDDTENSTNCQWVDAGAMNGVIDPGEGDCPAFNNCRAGSILSFANKTGGQKWYNKNSTFYSNGDTIMTASGANTCNGSTLYDNRNSIFISGIEFNDGVDKADFFFSDGSGTCADGTLPVTGDYNLVINSKNGSGDITGQSNSTWSASDVSRFVGTIPLNTSYLTDEDIIDNFFLTSATNDADETVSCQSDCSIDFQSFSRGASWDIGAIEYGSTPSSGGSTTVTITFGGVKIILGGGKITQ